MPNNPAVQNYGLLLSATEFDYLCKVMQSYSDGAKTYNK
jgi:hypothetical protein